VSKVDKENVALYFRLDETKIVGSEEVRHGVILDYNEKDQVVGTVCLCISGRTSGEELSNLPVHSRGLSQFSLRSK